MRDRKAKVFISCGQRPDERGTAEKVKEILDSNGYNAYLAVEVMSLDDIVKITQELNSSDYFLFIGFYREFNENNKIPISLFSHQELA